MKKVFALIAALALCAAVYAQEAPKAGALGITGSVGTSSASIGAWFNVNSKIVLRPALGFSYTNTPAVTTGGFDDSSTGFSLSVTGLYELPIAGGLVLGVGPSLGDYLSSSSSSSVTTYGTTVLTTKDTTTSNTFAVGAVASAQYFFAKSVGLFLDVGIRAAFSSDTTSGSISYSDGTPSINTSVDGAKTTAIDLDTLGLGIVFLLK
jgi:hypothetical protein